MNKKDRGISVLIVDDDETILSFMSILLEEEGYEVESDSSSVSALRKFKALRHDILITDLMMPELNGIDLIKKARQISPDSVFLILTGNASVETAISAMKHGAYDYLAKPPNPEELLFLLERASEKVQLVKKVENLRSIVNEKYNKKNIVGMSVPMKNVFNSLEKAEKSDATVLIQGESGTGKELVAKAVYSFGLRSDMPFITVNCCDIQESLIESELFGHKKGSFTGTVEHKKGLFEEADTGTIFLDEIGEITSNMQKKFLRVIQEGEIKRIGENKYRKVNIRIIAATNKDLKEEVEKGCFREDLYYRLNVISIKIPPLRERKEDIPLLISHFLKRLNQKYHTEKKISPETVNLLCSHDYPGNVRELENTIERMLLYSGGETIKPADIPADIVPVKEENTDFALHSESLFELNKKFEQTELSILKKALNENKDKKTAAASLGINLATLYRKIKKYSL
ncbi:MAG: sigma-54-dependent transcriptional regulator [Fibrobacterota bacterium]